MYRLTTIFLASLTVCLLFVAIGTSSYAYLLSLDDIPSFADDDGSDNSPDTNTGSAPHEFPADAEEPKPVFYRNGQPVEVILPTSSSSIDETQGDFSGNGNFPADDDFTGDPLDGEAEDAVPVDDTLAPLDAESPEDAGDDETHEAAPTSSWLRDIPLGLIAGAATLVVVFFVIMIWIFKGKSKKKTQTAIERTQVAPKVPEPQDASLRLSKVLGSIQDEGENEKKEEFRKQAEMRILPENLPPVSETQEPLQKETQTGEQTPPPSSAPPTTE